MVFLDKIIQFKRRALLVCSMVMFLSIGTLHAQRITVKGTVVDENGEPLAIASVLIKGTTTGVMADDSGEYTISVNPDAILQFMAVGYVTQEVPVRNRSVINISMQLDAALLEEAVITAEFGMKRIARSVGSSVQSVKASDVMDSGRESFVNALQGRVAGMTVTSTGGTPGASTTVVLRSITSISGSNQPLYVVDGVPINNSTFDPSSGFATDDITSSLYLDASSRGNDINPDDIESMTILKGAAAAALYGSAASNGAIIITTKKGTSGRGKVSYSNSFSFSKAYGYPEIQTKYANGMYGTTNYYSQSRFGGLYPEGIALYDNIASVLQTGFSQRHNVSVEGGTDKVTLRGSGSLIQQKGVVKTTDYSRKNIALSGRAEITKWLNFDANISYAATTNTKALKGTAGPLYRAVRWPLTDNMLNYITPDGKMSVPEIYTDTDLMNPLYALNKNVNYDTSERVTASVGLNITPTRNTYISMKYGVDTGSQTYEYHVHPYYGNPTSSGYGVGSYNFTKANFTDQSFNVRAGYNNTWGRFSFAAAVGYDQIENKNSSLAIYGSKFRVIDFYSIANCDPATYSTRERNTIKRVQGVFVHTEFGYNNMLFLTARARNDWSSTLPINNRSYFYPSLEGTFILTELKPLKGLTGVSYLKLRGAIAQVGKDANPLAIYPSLEATGDIGGGFRYGYYGPNPDLKPEMTTSYEVGLEGRFLNDRINVDFGYFWTECENQYITSFRLSYATGFVLNNMNVGTFTTNGLEFHIDGDIIRRGGFNWNLGMNITRSTSMVTSLPENVSEYYNAYTWLSGNLRNGIMIGHPVTTMTGKPYQRNDKGDILVDPGTGLPLTDSAWSIMGDRQPKLDIGIQSSMSFKGFRLSALFDARIGATVVNATKRDLMASGSSWESVALRENGAVVFKGVLKNGLENSSNPTVNNISVDFSQYATTTWTSGDEEWLEKDVNYLKLAELKLTYQIPRKWLQSITRSTSTTATVWVGGNDLLTLTNYSGIDVAGNSNSAALGGSGGVGIDYWGIPNPRSFSFGISITF